MKKIILLSLSLMALGTAGTAQEEIIQKELQFSGASADKALIVDNINGNIEVEGYDGQSIKLTIAKTIEAKSEDLRKTGREEVEIGIVEKEDIILIYMKNPCRQVDPSAVTRDYFEEGWNENWDNNCRWNPKYDFRIDYKLQVPKNLNIKLSTINKGEVSVKEVSGRLIVNNINGGISLEHISGATEASTINGDLQLSYAQNPRGASRYYTLNGDINALYQKGLSAEVYFKSSYGDFYTNIDGSPLPVKTEKIKNQNGIAYKIGGGGGLKVGNGDAKLEFETFNGDVYVKEVNEK